MTDKKKLSSQDYRNDDDELWAEVFEPAPSPDEDGDSVEESEEKTNDISQHTSEDIEEVPVGEVAAQWWGSYDFELDQMGLWQIGPSNLYVQRLEQEWRISHKQEAIVRTNTLEVAFPLQPSEHADDQDVQEDIAVDYQIYRYLMKTDRTTITLSPALADRPLIVKPDNPFMVPSKEEVTMFVTSPVWIRIALENNLLREIPSFRPSDTWFGPSTLEGELCYASKLLGQLNLAGIQRRPYRVATPLVLRNQSDAPLLVEKIRLPLQYLSIFQAEDNFLWTQAIVVTQRSDNQTQLRVRRGSPQVYMNSKNMGRVGEPRERLRSRLTENNYSFLRFRRDKKVQQ